ncbi:MAG: hypothetical protein LBV66_02515, partial [Elusimicrobiota bacterium]|jgi:trk system potassium uptake protein TrkH|nr:hypothetical protein [Elusimicrobiota bacterium]
LKVTTVVVILASIRSFIRSDESVTIFKRRLSDDIVKKASMIFILFFSSIVVLSMALIIAEPDKNPIDLVFEIISAFSTAGLSINITPNLNTAGKILDIIAMIAGRIGITTLLIFTAGKTIQQNKVKYPQADIFVG